jgi:hypothetical protein
MRVSLWVVIASGIVVMATTALAAEGEHRFPSDANLINVRDFGAVGDGVHDDTEALQNAINRAEDRDLKVPGGNPNIVIPAGTYLVTDTIDYGKNHSTAKRLLVDGAGAERSIIKLRDHAEKFQWPDTPRPVFSTFSGPSTNEAFLVQINNIAIDVGTGNPGATGMHFMANNVGGLRNVRIVSSDPEGAGSVGLDLTAAWVGPALFDRVTIRGFDTGITTRFDQYGVTFRDLTLEHQRKLGIANVRDSLTIDGLVSRNTVPVIHNSSQGFIALVRGRLQAVGHTDQVAIAVDRGASLHTVDTTITGYAEGNSGADQIALGPKSPKSMVIADGAIHTDIPAFALPDPKFAEPPEVPLDKWSRVGEFTGAAIQQAMDAGRPTVYFPRGLYLVSSPITIPPDVRRVVGFGSRLKLAKGFPTGMPVLTIDPRRRDSLVIESLDASTGAPIDTVWIFNAANADVLIRDSLLVGIGYRGQGGPSGAPRSGHVFLSNVNARKFEFDHQDVVAWQLNPEGDDTKVINKGGHLTIYGLKTEGGGAILSSDHGTATVFGGEIFVNSNIPTDHAAFNVTEGRICVSAVEVSNHPAGRGFTEYTVLMASAQDNLKTRMTADYPRRGTGRTYPAVCTP